MAIDTNCARCGRAFTASTADVRAGRWRTCPRCQDGPRTCPRCGSPVGGTACPACGTTVGTSPTAPPTPDRDPMGPSGDNPSN
jgi:hypothetical protein